MVRFVDDEHRALLGFQGEPGDLSADDAEGAGAVALGGQSQFPGDGLVHVHHVAGRQGHVEDAVEAGVESRGDLAADGGFAGAGLAGDQADGAQFQQGPVPRVWARGRRYRD